MGLAYNALKLIVQEINLSHFYKYCIYAALAKVIPAETKSTKLNSPVHSAPSFRILGN
ncbi:hypothetical protein THIOSC13_220002 [uncultured Thiomicrorhabdus sp.]